MDAPERIWAKVERIELGGEEHWTVHGTLASIPFDDWMELVPAARIAALTERAERAEAERDNFRAVLESAGYGDIDGIASQDTEQCRLLGATVAALTIAREAALATAEARLEATEHVNANLRDRLKDAREAIASDAQQSTYNEWVSATGCAATGGMSAEWHAGYDAAILRARATLARIGGDDNG